MEQKLDLQRYDKRLISMVKLIEKIDISERNKKLIFKFRDDCVRQGLSKPRIVKLLEILKSTALILDKDLDQLKRKDIEKFVTIIQEREYSPWTKQSYKIILRKFVKWVKKTDDYPEEVKWIKTNISRNQLTLPTQEGLITEDEVKLLIHNAEHPRDKALIAVLYESGCRISEILTLRIKNITIDKHGIVLSVFGKTGSRKVRIIASTQYLVTWLDNHPMKNDPDSPLWTNIGQRNFHEYIKYQTARRVLQITFQKAKIKKRFNPHLFRHSRATFLANHLTEFQMNQYFGWIQGSNMPATYVHLSGKETDSALLELNGVKIDKEQKESSLKPITCPRCDNINTHDAKFCSKCAGILNIQTAMQLEDKRREESMLRKEGDDIMNKLLSDPEVMKLITEKMATMGLK